jgi:hypothetical protein
MAEYKSFHYLMHQVPDTVKPVYVTGPSPLQFHELYTPRGSPEDAAKPRLIYKGEKSFWRTRDRIEFSFFESRLCKTMIVASQNIDNQTAYRTIFLNLEALYFELESKARGDRLPLTKKKDRKLDETLLHKSASDYILARLNIGADPVPWPKFVDNVSPPENTSAGTPSLDVSLSPLLLPAVDAGAAVSPPSELPQGERMCVFLKLSGDACSLEIERPASLSLDSIDAKYLKLEATTPAPSQSSSLTSSSSSVEGSVAGAPEPVPTATPSTSTDITKAVDESVKVTGKGKETTSSSGGNNKLSKDSQASKGAPSSSTTAPSNTKAKPPANTTKKSSKN